MTSVQINLGTRQTTSADSQQTMKLAICKD